MMKEDNGEQTTEEKQSDVEEHKVKESRAGIMKSECGYCRERLNNLST